MDQLGIPLKGGVHELKVGASFSSKKATSDTPAFHAFRYDFKPVSIDTSKPSTVSVGEKNEVNVVMPNVEGSAQPMTHFKGPKREAKKQCVLILNHDTGEITLEKLSHDVVLKRQRLDGTSKAYVKAAIPPSASTSTTSVEKGAATATPLTTVVSQSGSTSSANDMGPALPSAPATSITQLKKTMKKKKKSKQPCSAADDDDAATKATQQQPPSLKQPSRTPSSNALQPIPTASNLSPAPISAPSSRPDSDSFSLAPRSDAKNMPSKASPVNRLSSSSSSSSSSDDSSGPESDNEGSKSSFTVVGKASPPAAPPVVASRPPPPAAPLTVSDYKSLQDDLCLSESGSDSD